MVKFVGLTNDNETACQRERELVAAKTFEMDNAGSTPRR